MNEILPYNAISIYIVGVKSNNPVFYIIKLTITHESEICTFVERETACRGIINTCT